MTSWSYLSLPARPPGTDLRLVGPALRQLAGQQLRLRGQHRLSHGGPLRRRRHLVTRGGFGFVGGTGFPIRHGGQFLRRRYLVRGSPSAQAGGLSEAHAALRRPASVSAALRRPASVSAALRRPASVSAALRRPASAVSAALRRPASVSVALRRPASVSAALRRPASALAPAPSQVLGKEPISGG